MQNLPITVWDRHLLGFATRCQSLKYVLPLSGGEGIGGEGLIRYQSIIYEK
jgi:hypothetical protein